MEKKNKLNPSEAIELSGIQDSFCYRALKEARDLAEQLVDEKGHFRKQIVTRNTSSEGYSDDAFLMHQQKFLIRWQKDPLFSQKFRRFSLPLFHPFAHEVVRWTLDLHPNTTLKDFHIKRAALTTCLTPLRQSVGSCFATAPAIEIQQFHIDLFIDDLYELLSRGRLRRVVDGIEYAAPFCLSMGAGDLNKKIELNRPFFASPGLIRAFEIAGKISENSSFGEKIAQSERICSRLFRPGMQVRDLIPEETHPFFKSVADNALLKIWEFTLASYCDIKMEFSKWNLGWCVGLSPQEAGGIGSLLLRQLEEKLQQNREEMGKRYQEAVSAQDMLHAAESLRYRASTEAEFRRLKADIIAKVHHFKVCQELYQETIEKEKIIARALKMLIEQYTQKFMLYFQEIYDPEFEIQKTHLYEDRRAGFRLIYKHGRSESLLWTAVQNQEQFIAVLDDFFRSTEVSIVDFCQEAYEKQLVSEMTTEILHHLQSSEFIQTAMERAKKQGRLPWAYSSGGIVEQIASLYFRRSSPLKSEHRPIQDELDLFTFMIETMKGFPPSMTDQFSKDATRTLLFQSPTHVCLLLPGASLFHKGWNDPGLTYTWIRDQWMLPAKQFYQELTFSKEEQRELYKRLGVEGALERSMNLEEFVRQVPQIPKNVLGAFLFQTLPLVSAEQCQAVLQSDNLKLPPYLSSEELFLLMPKESMMETRLKMQALKLAPSTFLFADTNWPGGYFSFVIDPVTLQLEVWKTDLAGVRGASLPLVKSWFKSDPWFIFWN